MSTEPTKIILSTSDEAATYRTDIKGWVSRAGRYYGEDEDFARYDGCTHRPCEDCGAPTPKSYIRCDACQSKADVARWESLPRVEWDGETPLCEFDGDRYFFGADELYDYAENEDLRVSEMRLVVCTPRRPQEVDADYWQDDVPEDEELPPWLEDAVEQLNKVIRAHRHEPLSWYPGKQRVVLPNERRA